MIDKTHAAAMQSIMSQIRRFESQVKEPAKSEMSPLDGATPSLTPTSKTGFGDAVKQAINAVNDLQQKASGMATAYERGGDVPLTDVMLAMQKSSIAFEATLQIRNKVMRAYEEIKNMPV
jgi:flagellar hook-basal body complex protein FliE